MTAQLATLSLRREGTVQVHVGGDFHCGHPSVVSREGRVQVRYQVQLECTPTLNAQGFLVDQNAVHEVFLGLTAKEEPWTESCEQLTVAWGEALIRGIRENNPHVEIREMSLTLSPYPHGGALGATFRAR